MGAQIEQAVNFTRADALLAWEGDTQRYYFGHEFCQRLLPSDEELQNVIRHAQNSGRALTFVTPFVTNAGLKQVKRLTERLLDAGEVKALEIVVNDWGCLHYLQRAHPEVPLALGRLLTKQKRGPRILRIINKLPPAATRHFQRSNCDTEPLQQFLKTHGVQRVELDNLLQGIQRNSGLPASLHTPYGYITTTRLCLLMDAESPEKDLRSIGRCTRECSRYRANLEHPDMPVPLFLRGNTQFYKNTKLPTDLKSLRIDRIVTSLTPPH